MGRGEGLRGEWDFMSAQEEQSRVTPEEREARRVEKVRRAAARVAEAERLSVQDPATARRHAERRTRAAFFDESAALVPLVAVKSGDDTFFVHTADAGVGRSLFVDGSREEMRALERAAEVLRGLRPGWPGEDSVFIDIGANIGTTTVPALTRHGFHSAVACEPDPANASLLELNLAANGLAERATVVRAAASDSEGAATLALSGDNHGDHRVVHAGDSPAAGRTTIEVPLLATDSLLEAAGVTLERVGLVWIDAQGHEAAVLAGASRLIGAGTPVVFELWAAELERNGSLPRLVEAVQGVAGELLDLRDGGSRGDTALIEDIGAACLAEDRITDLLLVPAPA